MKFGRSALLAGAIGLSTVSCASPQIVTVRPICVIRTNNIAIYHITAGNVGQYTLELILASGTFSYYAQDIIQNAQVGEVIGFESAILPFFVVYRPDVNTQWTRVSIRQELPPIHDCILH
jgi:hypothetical protein